MDQAEASSASESGSAPALSSLARKYRKKLRQIENLERLNRPLTEEECVKVSSKSSIRSKLKEVLERIEVEEESVPTAEESSFSGTDQLTSDGFDSSCNNAGYDQQEDAETNDVPVEASTTVLSGAGDGVKSKVKADPEPASSPDFPAKPNVTTKSSTKATSSKTAKTLKPGKGGNQLHKSKCRRIYMDGHSDIITDLVVVDGRVVTASRDTSLKSWDLTTGEELRTFGGHTDSVTCVIALDAAAGKLVDPDFAADDHLIISSSFDCTFKMWSLDTGKLLKSVYTFNPLTRICFFSNNKVVTGSDGGKLELWDIASGENMFSSLAYESSITGIVVSGNIVYSSSDQGSIQVHELRVGNRLACVFVNDDVKTAAGRPLTFRHVRCMTLNPQGILLYGDDARNIKVLDWKKGQVSKLSNHSTNFTSTDAVACHDGYVLTSSYDLDDGLGYVNVRKADASLTYLATLDDGETERIICLDFCLDPSGHLVVVTGGLDLALWHFLPQGQSRSEDADDIIGLDFRQVLSLPAVDSDSEAEDDDEEEDDESDDEGDERSDDGSSQDSGWTSWCSIL